MLKDPHEIPDTGLPKPYNAYPMGYHNPKLEGSKRVASTLGICKIALCIFVCACEEYPLGMFLALKDVC